MIIHIPLYKNMSRKFEIKKIRDLQDNKMFLVISTMVINLEMIQPLRFP